MNRSCLALPFVFFGFIASLEAENLILHYSFNNPDPTVTSVQDSSGNERGGEFENASGAPAALQASAGVSGKGGDFAFDNGLAEAGTDGMGATFTGGVVRAPLSAHAMFGSLSSFTVTAWIKPKSTWSNYATILDIQMVDRKRRSDPAADLSIAARSVGAGRLVFALGENRYVTETISELTGVDEWIFVAVTYDSAASSENVKVYVGTPTSAVQLVQAGTLSAGAWQAVSSGAMTVHVGNNPPKNRPFFGAMDDLRIYGDESGNGGALTKEQLEAIRESALSKG